MTVPDIYAVWRSLLPSSGRPAADSPVSAGFWRLSSAKGHATPVATWFDDGWVASVGEAFLSDIDGDEWLKFVDSTWPRLEAMEEAAYNTARETGRWPDVVPVARGENLPAEGVERLKAEIDGLAERAEEILRRGAARTKEEADIASNLASDAVALKGRAIDLHKAEKDPHLKAGRAVDGVYFPLRDRMADVSSDLKAKVINPYQVEQARLRKEAAEKAEDAGQAVEAKSVSTGAKGRKAKLIDVRYGRVVDPVAFAKWLAERDPPNPDMVELLTRTANRMASVGAAAPGVEIYTKQETR